MPASNNQPHDNLQPRISEQKQLRVNTLDDHQLGFFAPCATFLNQNELRALEPLQNSTIDQEINELHFLHLGTTAAERDRLPNTERAVRHPTTCRDSIPVQERILAAEDLITSFQDRWVAALDAKLSDFADKQDTLSFVVLLRFTEALDSQLEEFKALGNSQSLSTQPFQTSIFAVVDALRAKEQQCRQTLAHAENYDACIDALAAHPKAKIGSLLIYRFATHLRRAIECRTPDELSTVGKERFLRVTSFLEHLQNLPAELEAEINDNKQEYRLVAPFSGAAMAYETLSELLRGGSTDIFNHPATRPQLQPLLKKARLDFQKNISNPPEALASSMIMTADTCFNNALFTLSAFPYEQNHLMQTAIEAGSLLPLRVLSFNYFGNNTNEATCLRASELLLKVATTFRAAALESATMNRSIEKTLQDAGLFPSHPFGTTTIMSQILSQMFSASTEATKRISTHYSQQASQEQSEVWYALMPEKTRSLLHSLSEQGLLQRPYQADYAYLSLLAHKFSGDEFDHLIGLPDASSDTLKVFLQAIQQGNIWFSQDPTHEAIMKADSFATLLKQLQAQLELSFESDTQELKARASNQLNQEGLTNQQIDYLQLSLKVIPIRIAKAVEEIFHARAPIYPEMLRGIMQSRIFVDIISGKRDLSMHLAPTPNQTIPFSNAQEQLLRMYPEGIFQVTNIESSDSIASAQHKVQLKKKLYQELLKRFSNYFEPDSDIGSVSELLQQSFEFREEVWNLLGDAVFQNEFLNNLLAAHNSKPLTAQVKVLAKSDPQSWLLPPETARIAREDATLLSIKVEDKRSQSVLWRASDNETLIVSSLDVPYKKDFVHRRKLQEAVSDFLIRYAKGEIESPTPIDSPKPIKRIVLNSVPTYLENLPLLTSPARPSGRDPDFKQSRNKKNADTDLKQYILWEAENSSLLG